MRRLVAGASALCCILVALLALAVGAGPARASEWRDLDERLAELEQTTVRGGGRRLMFKTTFYADRGIYENFNVGAILSVVVGTVTPWGTLVDIDVHRWGLGAEQAIDAANMLVYAQAHFYDPTIVGSACAPPGCAFDPAQPTTKLPAASWQGFVIGARIQF
jgi:hypothetical protein